MNRITAYLFAAFLLVLTTSVVMAGSKPNILFLYADDLGYGDLGCYNPQSKIPTPHLDKLASEGMRFTDGHSSSGVCTPSRYALLTGRYHWRNPELHTVVAAFEPSILEEERLTLAEMLSEAGYTTALVGKWHLGWDWEALRHKQAKQYSDDNRKYWKPDAFDWSKPIPDGPLAHGFDIYFGDDVINYPPYGWIENDRLLEGPTVLKDESLWQPVKEGNWDSRPGPMVAGWDPYANLPTATEKGVALIKDLAKDSQPFFLFFAFPCPHTPIIPNDEYDGRSQAGPYGDFVVETDAACGALLAALEEAGVSDNTIVFFSSDNGPEYHAYARDLAHGHWSSYPLRGLKRDLYEGGHRVPYIIKWPGLTPEGSVSNALVSQIDLMGTIAAALDMELPENQAEDSHNLIPVLSGARQDARSSFVHNTKEGRYALRHGSWVLIDSGSGQHTFKGDHEAWRKKNGYASTEDSSAELYNLADDIGQKNDVAAKYPERVAALQERLQKILQGESSAPRLVVDSGNK